MLRKKSNFTSLISISAGILLLFLLVPPAASLRGQTGKTRRVVILHTNDIQSRLLGFGPNAEYSPAVVNNDDTIGGFARLATLIKQRRAAAAGKGHTTLLLDGGDITMGTLFHTVTRETGGELRLMQRVGYDAAVIGNHEFDFRPAGLAAMIRSALRGGGIPPLLMSNLAFNETDPADDSLSALFHQGHIKRYHILEKDGLRIGLLGVMGADAFEVSLAAPMVFRDPMEAVRPLIKFLKEKKKVDMILLLSHSGIHKEKGGKWSGPEVEFARKLEGINAVIGGHSHTAVPKPPIIRGNVPVVQAGSEARYLGELVMEVGPAGVKFISYKLIPVNDTIPGDPAVTRSINELKNRVNRRVLAGAGYKFDQPLARTARDLTRRFNDAALGNIVADAVRRAGKSDIAFVPNGTIRDDVLKGRTGVQRVSDVFRISPLGVGEFNDAPGYPLVRFYLNGKELKSVVEVLSFGYRLKGRSYYPRFSGLRFWFNPWRFPLDTVYRVQLGDSKKGWRDIDIRDGEKLYSITMSTYVARNIGLIKKLSYGIHDVIMKDAKGRPVKSLKEIIMDGDPTRPGTQEIKEWKALFDYIRALPASPGGPPFLPLDESVGKSRMQSRAGFSTLFRFAGLTWLYLLLIPLLTWPLLSYLRKRRATQYE